MSFISIILLTALVLNATLGLFVFLGRARTASNLYYFVLVVFISVWIFMNYLVEFVTTENQAWLLSTVAYVSILGIAYTFLLFCYHFPHRTFPWTKQLRFLVLLATALVGTLVFIPGFAVDRIVVSPWKIVTGPGLSVVFSWFILLMIAAFAVLIAKLRSPTLTPQEKPQVHLVLLGTAVAAILGSVFNLLLPFLLQDYDYVRIGPIFTLIMVVFIAVAIVRYHLFDIKVIATQTFAVVLCGFLFVRTLASNSLTEQLVNGGLFVATVVVCVFLVRSALKEVEQREALAVANDNQKNLIRIMNHQIKGRLGAGKNIFAELLADDYGTVTDAARILLRKGLEEMDTGVSYIQTILHGMSADNGTLSYDMQPMDFQEMVLDEVSKERDRAEKKGLTLEIKCGRGDYHLLGDAAQLREVVRNLVDNAITYTVHGGVSIALQREHDALILTVKDTGVGIPEDDKRRLFTAGGRGKNAAKINVNSTGYGLVFVKGVVEAHKGKVWFESIPGSGTTFFVEIPIKHAREEAVTMDVRTTDLAGVN